MLIAEKNIANFPPNEDYNLDTLNIFKKILNEATIDLGPEVFLKAFQTWEEERVQAKMPKPDYEKIGLTISEQKLTRNDYWLQKMGNQQFYSYCEGSWS